MTESAVEGLIGKRAVIGEESWFIADARADGTPGEVGYHLHLTLTDPRVDHTKAIVQQWRNAHDDIGV